MVIISKNRIGEEMIYNHVKWMWNGEEWLKIEDIV